MRKPNFFILGAPKCGTTALATWLASHDNVFVSAEKEPHYFNTDMRHRIFTNRDSYESLFSGSERQRAVGEASVWYLYSRDAVANIERYVDSPLYIVCLRHPTDMAYSLHKQQVFSGNERELDFGAAWRLAKARRLGQEVPKNALDVKTLIYPDACAVGSQLLRLTQQIGWDRIHVVLMDDIQENSRAVFDRVQRFLGVLPDSEIELPVVNAAKSRKSMAFLRIVQGVGRVKTAIGMKHGLGLLKHLDKANSRPLEGAEMNPELRSELITHFENETALVEQLLARNLPAWRT